MGPGDSIKLSEAPALFFADAWMRIVSLKDGAEKALQALDHPDPVMIVVCRRRFLEANRNDPESLRAALAAEEAYALVDKLISDLRREAKLEFGARKLSSETFVYNHVTVKRAAEPVETIIKRLTARLVECRAQQGDEIKKVLQAAMAEEFGEECTTRAFNDAYRACYGRSRGRPKTK